MSDVTGTSTPLTLCNLGVLHACLSPCRHLPPVSRKSGHPASPRRYQGPTRTRSSARWRCRSHLSSSLHIIPTNVLIAGSRAPSSGMESALCFWRVYDDDIRIYQNGCISHPPMRAGAQAQFATSMGAFLRYPTIPDAHLFQNTTRQNGPCHNSNSQYSYRLKMPGQDVQFHHLYAHERLWVAGKCLISWLLAVEPVAGSSLAVRSLVACRFLVSTVRSSGGRREIDREVHEHGGPPHRAAFVDQQMSL
ncbi:hypothetical protein VTO73DRAFT_13094 [Trametes versicolor]